MLPTLRKRLDSCVDDGITASASAVQSSDMNEINISGKAIIRQPITPPETSIRAKNFQTKCPEQSEELLGLIVNTLRSLDRTVPQGCPEPRRRPQSTQKISLVLDKAPKHLQPDLAALVPKLVEHSEHPLWLSVLPWDYVKMLYTILFMWYADESSRVRMLKRLVDRATSTTESSREVDIDLDVLVTLVSEEPEEDALAERLKVLRLHGKDLMKNQNGMPLENKFVNQSLENEVRRLTQKVGQTEGEKREKEEQVARCEAYIDGMESKLQGCQDSPFSNVLENAGVYVLTTDDSVGEKHGRKYSDGGAVLQDWEGDLISHMRIRMPFHAHIHTVELIAATRSIHLA
ncbi:hypothetical protein V6N13_128474 [Hibiscus sabdariffa]|uniref:Uncharacterized protein n=1 Tax=Hibiscus sabdariffa TaxID=183260 RepID=A0ABR2P0Q1_9ROSI